MISTPAHRAFTLVELLAVLAIIVVLLAMLLPATQRALEQANRAVCAANLKVISTGAADYALHNRKVLFICRGRSVQVCFNAKGVNAHSNRTEDAQVDWPAALASVGLAGSAKEAAVDGHVDNHPLKMWDCPSRGYKSNWDTIYTDPWQMIISYGYYGGIEWWVNAQGTFPANSPIQLDDGGSLVLAADLTMKVGGIFAGADHDSSHWAYGAPAHRGGGKSPEGQNQAYLDGSVEFVRADRLIYLHAWYADINHAIYLWQRDLNGYEPRSDLYLSNDAAYEP